MKLEQVDKFLTVSDLAQYLRIKPATIYAMVESRKIPHYKIGRLIRFKKDEIDQWLEMQKRGDVVKRRKSAGESFLGSKALPGHINRIIQGGIDDVIGGDYNHPHGKPDPVKGLRKEAKNGVI